MLKSLRSNSGFTLIEILIVIAIIAIIVGIAVPALGTARDNARAAKASAVAAQLATAKVRVLLDGHTLGTDETSYFAAVSTYLSVNGIQPTDITSLKGGLGVNATIVIGDSTTAPVVTPLD